MLFVQCDQSLSCPAVRGATTVTITPRWRGTINPPQNKNNDECLNDEHTFECSDLARDHYLARPRKSTRKSEPGGPSPRNRTKIPTCEFQGKLFTLFLTVFSLPRLGHASKSKSLPRWTVPETSVRIKGASPKAAPLIHVANPAMDGNRSFNSRPK